uniref:Putative response regulator receiver protein n=1 Tax=Magnetococcus massalia (strain MO-1) TaxID=451514 RepID=A0A1S7LJC8_MAGMO|nr:putative response regulator receiver protein [Candidatus Magnetococcus massalia]
MATILIVDDDQDGRNLLARFLKGLDYRILQASGGEQGIAMFLKERPDLVLMDVIMPGMDGYEAVRRIRESSQDHESCPIIFLTAVDDDNELARCLDCGGDDFLAKPYRKAILRARIENWIKRAKLAIQVREHRDHLAFERRFVEKILERIRLSARLDETNINYLMDGLESTAGDILLAAKRLDGVQHLLIGDFTGHGLPAALGAPMVSDIFYSMTERGFTLQPILEEINHKLYDRLPTGMYLAMAALEVDNSRGRIKCWNAGVPDILIYDEAKLACRVPSMVIPLGIADTKTFQAVGYQYQSWTPKRLYAYSDGVIESKNPDGAMLDTKILESLLQQMIEHHEPLETIRTFLEAFRGETPQLDDITMVELTFTPSESCSTYRFSDALSAPNFSEEWEHYDWGLDLTFGPDAIRSAGMVPQILAILTMRFELSDHLANLYTILKELMDNAIDWGVLQLEPSTLPPSGAADRLAQQRAIALKKLTEGQIHLTIRHQLSHDGGRGAMAFRVKDSGPGFSLAKLDDDHPGLGLCTVSKLCQKISLAYPSNAIEAIYSL